MHRFSPLLCAAFLAALVLPAAEAVQTETQVLEGYEAWERGELDSLSLHWNGALTAGPRLRDHGAPEAGAIVWDLAARSAKGPVYASTGGPAAVYRYDPPAPEDEASPEPTQPSPGGEWTRVFSSPAPLVRALHLSADRTLWIGTSPDGRLYRIPSPGDAPEMFASLPADYLWEIREDPSREGHLLVATGAPGRILRIATDDPNAEPEVVAETTSTHVFTFAHGPEGTLYFATGPDGHLLRQEPDRAKVRTLAELGAGEVRGLFPAADGSVRIAVYRGEPGNNAPGSSSGGPGGTAPATPAHGASGSGNSPAGAPRGLPSGLFSIDAEGFVHPLLVTTGEEQVLAATLWKENILLGSDRRARLYRFHDRYDWSLVAEGPEGGEISALASPGPEGVWVASSNPARLYRIHPASSTAPGQYTSEVFDAGHKVRWGRLHTTGRQLEDLAVETRSGNRADPDSSWSGWTPLEEGRIASPAGRFLQFRLRLGATDGVLRRAEVFFQLPNEAPVFRRIHSLPVRLEPLPSPPASKQRTALSQLFQNHGNGGNGSGNGAGPNGPGGPPVVVHEERGYLSVLWEASDPNGDELRYDLYLRRLGEEEWTLLARALAAPFHSQQVAGFPPGYYEPRVVASDQRSNLPGEGLTAEKQGALVLLDHEDPVLVGPDTAHPRRVTATDAHSRILSLTFRLDGGEPQPLRPEDGLFDSRRETFRLPDDLGPAGTPLLLETEDAAGNRAAWSGRLPD